MQKAVSCIVEIQWRATQSGDKTTTFITPPDVANLLCTYILYTLPLVDDFSLGLCCTPSPAISEIFVCPRYSHGDKSQLDVSSTLLVSKINRFPVNRSEIFMRDQKENVYFKRGLRFWEDVQVFHPLCESQSALCNIW